MYTYRNAILEKKRGSYTQTLTREKKVYKIIELNSKAIMVVLEVSLKKLIFSQKKRAKWASGNSRKARVDKKWFLKKSKNSNVCISWMCADRINGSVLKILSEWKYTRNLRFARVHFASEERLPPLNFFNIFFLLCDHHDIHLCAKKKVTQIFFFYLATCEFVVAKMRAVVKFFSVEFNGLEIAHIYMNEKKK